MATFGLILMLFAGVLVSALLDQLIPKISLPLIQIAIGIIAAFFVAPMSDISVDPELFMVLFIAPLLFNDALEADAKRLFQDLPSILSLAVGLVVMIVLVVGYALNFIVPSIPLAAAFALGAALGPTDAVAVSSLSKEAKLGFREKAILQGECLLNDASGLVCFQFAIAAAVTGAFSLVGAAASFAIAFFGGIIVGLALGLLFMGVHSLTRNLGVDNVTFHVLFEVSIPFMVYLICEAVGVSGILGVVACGIFWSYKKDRRISPYQSRLNISLSSVWKSLAFALNGIVFVLLGLQLPGAFSRTWEDTSITNGVLIALVLGLTLLIVLLRFAWSLGQLLLAKSPATGKRPRLSKKLMRAALVTTAGGPKGAITLSIIMSIPFLTDTGAAFPQRYLLIFLASGVILCTLLIANFLLPVLAPMDEEDKEGKEQFYLTRIEILRSVIERLIGEQTYENEDETRTVVAGYNERILRIRDDADLESPSVTKLRIAVIDKQSEAVFAALDMGELDRYEAFRYLRNIMKQKNLLAKQKNSLFKLRRYYFVFREYFSMMRRNLIDFIRDVDSEEDEASIPVRVCGERAAIEFLNSLVNKADYPSEVVAQFLIAHERRLARLDPSDPLAASLVPNVSADKLDAVKRRGLQIEAEVTQDLYATGQITRSQLVFLRNNVNLMFIDLDDRI